MKEKRGEKLKNMKQKDKKKDVFCLVCCGFKAKREEIGDNSFGCDGKTERIFPAQMFFKPRDQKQKKEFFPTFFQESNSIFNLGYIFNGVMKRNRVKKKNQKKGE